MSTGEVLPVPTSRLDSCIVPCTDSIVKFAIMLKENMSCFQW